MPFKRVRSPYWQIEKRLPGYGFTGRLSTRVRDLGVARRMESLLDDLAAKALTDPAWYPLLDAICKDHTVTLANALRARGSGRLLHLRRSLTDPLIKEAVRSYKSSHAYDRPVWVGLDWLTGAAGDDHLGDLTGRRITELCMECEKTGLKRNSVRRQLYRAMSLLLRFHLGSAERNRIFADVRFASEDDTREVYLSPAEIGKLLNACSELSDDQRYMQLELIVRLALATSADRGVLLSGPARNGARKGRIYRGLLVRDIQIFRTNETGRMRGVVDLHDMKAKSRSRRVPIADSLCRSLLAQVHGRSPDDPVFDIRYMDLDYLWKRVRKASGLMHVRFKDLRAQTAIYIEEAGIPATVAQRTLGHASEAMTRRYLQRSVTMTDDQAEALDGAMFGPGNAQAASAV